MPLVKWNEELSVRVPSLDNQHKKMLFLLNELHEGMMSGRDKIALGGVLSQLVSATASHIRHEEELLARAGYRDEPAHRQRHVDLMRQVCGIRRQYESIGPSALTLAVMSFLKNGLISHIRDADLQYRDCLSAQGIQ
jgi:hemerythrin-like metal-binding protein